MPVFVVAESETVWMNFLTHNFLRVSLLFGLGLLLRSLPGSRLLSRIGLLSRCFFLLRRRAFRTWRCHGSTAFAAFALRELRRFRFFRGLRLGSFCRGLRVVT